MISRFIKCFLNCSQKRYWYASRKRCDFSCRQNSGKESVSARRLIGNEFQTVGPAKSKRLTTVVIRVYARDQQIPSRSRAERRLIVVRHAF